MDIVRLREGLGRRGSSLVDPLLALVILGLGSIALSTLLLSAARGAHAAALEGRRAALAQRTLDHVRSGMASADDGVLRAWPDGEGYEAVWTRRDDVAPGAIEISVASVVRGGALVLGAARPDL